MFVLEEDDLRIYIKREALLSILAPIIENYTKETGGLLVGEIERQWIDGCKENTITIKSAYPSITAKSDSKEWIPVNIEAQKRAIKVASSLSLFVLGGYHSHIDSEPTLSEDDKEFIIDQQDLQLFKMSQDQLKWMELVIRVSRKDYSSPKKEKSNWFSTSGGYKIRENFI